MKPNPITPQGWLMLFGLWGGMLLAGWAFVTVLNHLSVGVVAAIGTLAVSAFLMYLNQPGR